MNLKVELGTNALQTLREKGYIVYDKSYYYEGSIGQMLNDEKGALKIKQTFLNHPTVDTFGTAYLTAAMSSNIVETTAYLSLGIFGFNDTQNLYVSAGVDTLLTANQENIFSAKHIPPCKKLNN